MQQASWTGGPWTRKRAKKMNKTTMRVKLCRTLVGCSLLFPLLYACSVQVAPSSTSMPSQEEEALSQDYVIGSEDSVEVQVWKILICLEWSRCVQTAKFLSPSWATCK